MELIDIEYGGRTFYAYLAWIDPSSCSDDFGYQRIRDDKHVNQIIENFSLLFFGAAVVADNEDNTYTILDAGHRCEAAIKRGIDKIPALILVGLNFTDRSLVFHELNDKRRGLRPVDKYKSELAYGDSIALEIERVLKIHGLKLGRSKSKNNPNTISAVHTVNEIVKNYGGDTLDWVLGVITQAYLEPKFDSGVLTALANIFKNNQSGPNQVDATRMIKTLKAARSEKDIVDTAVGTTGSGHNTKLKRVYNWLIDKYNTQHIKGPNSAARRLV